MQRQSDWSSWFLGRREIYGPVLLFFLGLILVRLLLLFPMTTQLEVQVDAEIEGGHLISIFVNQDYSRSPSIPIVAGKRQVYKFEKILQKITEIRLDPTDLAQKTVKIYKFSILKNGLPIKEVFPAEMARWPMMVNLTSEVKGDYLEIHPVNEDPIMVGRFDLSISHLEQIMFMIGSSVSELNWNLILLGLFFILMMGVWNHPIFYWPLLLGPVLVLVERKIAQVAPPFVRGPLNIRESVGISSFTGQAKSTEMRIFSLMVVVAVGFGFLCFALSYFFRRPQRDMPSSSEVKKGSLRSSLIFLWPLIIGFTVLAFPQIKALFEGLSKAVHAPDWDSLAILNWQYVAHMGWLPYKDYWFPYGGNWNEISPFPIDLLWSYLHQCLMVTVLIVCTYLLTARNRFWTLLILFTVLFFSETRQMLGLNRYLLAIDIVLFYLSLRRLSTVSVWPYIVFGLFLGWVGTFEPTQVFYASLPTLVVIGLHYYERRNSPHLNRLIGFHFLSLFLFLLVMSAYLLKLFWFGQLEGFLAFYQQLGAMTTQVSTPGDFQSWLQFKLQKENVVLIFSLIYLMWGLYLFLKELCCGRVEKGDIILAFGILATMIFFKHLIRPHMAAQFIAIHCIGGLLFLSLESRTWTRTQKLAGFFILGNFLSYSHEFQFASSLWGSYVVNSKNLLKNMQVLFMDRQKMNEQEDLFFAPRTFTEPSSAVAKLYEYLTHLRVDRQIPDFFVLGDDPYLYILAKKKPPRYVSLYDGCPIGAQRDTLDWLEKNKPELVIWDPNKRNFDGVPNIVRDPLLYIQVIHDYQLKSNLGAFLILERRTRSIDLAFWRQALGEVIDLGAIPMESSEKPLPFCEDSSTDCLSFLEVKVSSEPQNRQRRISVALQGLSFEIHFNQVFEKQVYHIFLDRIWFWEISRVLNVVPEISIADPDLQISVFKKRVGPRILY